MFASRIVSAPISIGPRSTAPGKMTTQSPYPGMPTCAARLADTADGNPLVDVDVRADHGGLSDDDAGAVIDE